MNILSGLMDGVIIDTLIKLSEAFAMNITVGNKVFSSIETSTKESAWSIKDALALLESGFFENSIILGGDVLDTDFSYNYDNWFYNINERKNSQSNSIESIRQAISYLSNYIKENGCDFYIVFVLRQSGNTGDFNQGTIRGRFSD